MRKELDKRRAEYEREKKEKRAELLRLSPALGGDRIPAF
jgi:hypothetical protein